jgi:beta-glucosidase
VHLDYRLPKLLITENGAAYPDPPDGRKRIADARRIDFLRRHLLAAKRAIDLGVPLQGYFAWSLMDNYEWDHGYSQRFGIAWVDYATQERILKDSGHWYRRVIEENAIPSEAGS